MDLSRLLDNEVSFLRSHYFALNEKLYDGYELSINASSFFNHYKNLERKKQKWVAKGDNLIYQVEIHKLFHKKRICVVQPNDRGMIPIHFDPLIQDFNFDIGRIPQFFLNHFDLQQMDLIVNEKDSISIKTDLKYGKIDICTRNDHRQDKIVLKIKWFKKSENRLRFEECLEKDNLTGYLKFYKDEPLDFLKTFEAKLLYVRNNLAGEFHDDHKYRELDKNIIEAMNKLGYL